MNKVFAGFLRVRVWGLDFMFGVDGNVGHAGEEMSILFFSGVGFLRNI